MNLLDFFNKHTKSISAVIVAILVVAMIVPLLADAIR